jgi:hypothetical protein
VETGRLRARHDQVVAIGETLDLPKVTLTDVYDDLRQDHPVERFEPYEERDRRATRILDYEAFAVPGLLQTACGRWGAWCRGRGGRRRGRRHDGPGRRGVARSAGAGRWRMPENGLRRTYLRGVCQPKYVEIGRRPMAERATPMAVAPSSIPVRRSTAIVPARVRAGRTERPRLHGNRPPPRPATSARVIVPNTSKSFRTAENAPDSAKAKIPTSSIAYCVASADVANGITFPFILTPISSAPITHRTHWAISTGRRPETTLAPFRARGPPGARRAPRPCEVAPHPPGAGCHGQARRPLTRRTRYGGSAVTALSP